MGEIYEGTRDAIIWLGDHVEATFSDLEMIERGREIIPTLFDGLLDPYTDLRLKDNAIFAGFAAVSLMPKLWHHNGPEILMYDEDSALQLHPQWPRGLDGLFELTQFPWWSQTWTAQESIHPSSATIVYGSLEVTLDTLSDAMSQVGQKCGKSFAASKPKSIAYLLWDLYMKVTTISKIKLQKKTAYILSYVYPKTREQTL